MLLASRTTGKHVPHIENVRNRITPISERGNHMLDPYLHNILAVRGEAHSPEEEATLILNGFGVLHLVQQN